MFTGIVEELGRVLAAGDHQHLDVEAPIVSTDSSVGDSIAVSGVCLTITQREGSRLSFDLADETLARSTLGSLTDGESVNLERPVTLLARLGGHLVQGHVDGVGAIEARDQAEGGQVMRISIPDGLGRYVVEKGSIAVNGVSLTVASVDETSFTVALIPHTLSATTLGSAGVGDGVNLEVDILAKYVESLLGRRA